MSNTSVPDFKISHLLDAGVHFGHKTKRWNPKMAPYIYGVRDGIHIIDLQKSAPLLHKALTCIYEVVKNNGRVLFVGTKRQASSVIAEYAERCGQYYVNYRWLGGMLTNWGTVSKSLKTLKDLEKTLTDTDSVEYRRLNKKEKLEISRRVEKLEKSLGGIREMGSKPDLLFIIDTNKESLAIQEAAKLNIPVIAIIDSNSDPEGIDFPVPGNDDAVRSIKLYCKLASDAALAGIQSSLSNSGVDIGAAEEFLADKETTSDKEEEKTAKKDVKKPAVKKAEPKASKTSSKKAEAKTEEK